MKITNDVVDRFLSWPLPYSVCADLCATKQQDGRIGTNLLTANEAKQMLEYLLPTLLSEAIAEYKEDAERYRWLRDRINVLDKYKFGSPPFILANKALDAAIDAARKSESEHG